MRTGLAILIALFGISVTAQVPPRVMDELLVQASMPTFRTSTTFSPTNITGYPAIAWFCASDYTTNGSIVSLNDMAKNAGGYSLTNMGAASGWPVRSVGELNGQDVLVFQRQFLDSQNYTSCQPHEVYIVWSKQIASDPDHYYISSYVSGNENDVIGRASGSGAMNMSAGTARLGPAVMITNKWYVIDVIFNGTSSLLYTNNVEYFSAGNAGTQTENGFGVGRRAGSATSPGQAFRIAEIITYGAGNQIPGTNDTTRTSIFNYLTNKYNISL